MNCWCSIADSPVAGSIAGWPNGPGSGACSSVNVSLRERNSHVGTPMRLEREPSGLRDEPASIHLPEHVGPQPHDAGMSRQPVSAPWRRRSRRSTAARR
jgi:hypothetical protein